MFSPEGVQAWQGSEGGVCACCVCVRACTCSAVLLATLWNLADKEAVSLTQCAATIPGLGRAIKMVAALLPPALAEQTGSRGGAGWRTTDQDSAAADTFVRQTVDPVCRRLCKWAFRCGSDCCVLSSLRSSSCSNFHKSTSTLRVLEAGAPWDSRFFWGVNLLAFGDLRSSSYVHECCTSVW